MDDDDRQHVHKDFGDAVNTSAGELSDEDLERMPKVTGHVYRHLATTR